MCQKDCVVAQNVVVPLTWLWVMCFARACRELNQCWSPQVPARQIAGPQFT
jgi:hypothetical protein